MHRARSARTVNQSTRDWMLWLGVFRELHNRPRTVVAVSAEREERHHLKTLRARLEPLGLPLEDYLREFASLDDGWLDERDYPLRHAVRSDNWTRIVKRLQDAQPATDSAEVAPAIGELTPSRAAWEEERRLKDEARQARLARCTCGRGGASGPCPVHARLS